MSSRDETRSRILAAARERFFRFGSSRVTMDEISSQLGMSKKTLYKYFPSKGDLLRVVAETINEEIDAGVDRIIHDDSREFVGKLKELMSFIAMQVARIGQPFLQDLQRNAPDLWEAFEERRQERVQNNLGKLVGEGIQAGVFRADVNQQFLVLMCSELIQRIINPEVLTHLPLTARQAFETIAKVFFEGILTDEARVDFHGRDDEHRGGHRRAQVGGTDAR